MQSGIPAYAMNAIMSQGQGGGGFSGSPIGQGFGQVLNSYFSNPTEPYRKAEAAYTPYFNKAVEAQNPFYRAGTAAIPQYQDYTNSMRDPSAFINHLMDQYQQSPWAKFQMDQSRRGAVNQASASGLSGSTPLAQFEEQNAHDISQQDMGQWLDRVLGINSSYGSNLQHQFDTGYGAGTNLSSIYGTGASDYGKLAYNKSAANNENTGNRISGLLKMFLG